MVEDAWWMPEEILSKDDLQAMGKFNQNGWKKKDTPPLES